MTFSVPLDLRRLLVRMGFALLVAYTAWMGRLERRHSPLGGVDGAGLRFSESARELGIEFMHERTTIDEQVANIAAHITAVGAAVSVVDANSDGLPDLFACTSATGGQSALYINAGNGRFSDQAAEAGLADLNRAGEGCVMGSVWADLDNDGDQDAFFYAWGRCRLFRNEGGLRFSEITDGSGLAEWVNSNGATWLDYDRDGVLDLYVTAYFADDHDLWQLRTTRIMHDSFEFSRNGGINRLYRGNGDGTFVDVTEATGVGSTRWTYAAVAADFDRDGWTDLYLANDYGPEELYLNESGRRFALARDVGLDGESKSGMCVTIGDALGQGALCVFVTNISQPGFIFQGNNLRASYVDVGGRLVQHAQGAVADCGWAWGAQFGDLDRDGRQDLVVANGFVSASRDRDYWYQMSKIGLATGDLVADARNWPPFEDRSLSGYERTRVLRNLGLRGAYFREVGTSVGIDDTYDGRAVALADLAGNGRLDVVIANQNGPLLVYVNEGRDDHHWLGLQLVGTTSNRDALGAEVRFERPAEVQLRVVTSASGFASQNDRRVHFGLGSDAGIGKVTIRWPSGTQQSILDLTVDRYHTIIEPRR